MAATTTALHCCPNRKKVYSLPLKTLVASPLLRHLKCMATNSAFSKLFLHLVKA